MKQETPDELLKRVWSTYVSSMGWDEAWVQEHDFVIDESLLSVLFKQAPALQLTPEQICSVVEVWRAKWIKSIDDVALRYKNEAQQQKGPQVSHRPKSN